MKLTKTYKMTNLQHVINTLMNVANTSTRKDKYIAYATTAQVVNAIAKLYNNAYVDNLIYNNGDIIEIMVKTLLTSDKDIKVSPKGQADIKVNTLSDYAKNLLEIDILHACGVFYEFNKDLDVKASFTYARANGSNNKDDVIMINEMGAWLVFAGQQINQKDGSKNTTRFVRKQPHAIYLERLSRELGF